MTAPKRFEVHAIGYVIPDDVKQWCLRKAEAHEREWGLVDDDVGISFPLCGRRGSVGSHVDFDYNDDTLICGLVIDGYGHELFSAGTGDAMPLGLYPGAVYVLDPSIEHGTIAGWDDRLLFLTDVFALSDTATPAELADRLIAACRKTMEIEP